MQHTKILMDELLMELYTHGTKEFPFQHYDEDISKFENQKIERHWHREFEFVSVSAGTVICILGDDEICLDEGDGIFINSGVIHGLEKVDIGFIPNILFMPEFIADRNSFIYEKYIAPVVDSGISCMVFRTSTNWQADILASLEQIYTLCERKQKNWELAVYAEVSRVWMLMQDHGEAYMTQDNVGIKRLSQARLRRMTDYIEKHYMEKVTLDDIARSAEVSKSETLRCFKNELRISPIEYLNNYRLHLARRLLLETKYSITAIAENTGFTSTSYFDRMYKREFGLTPKEQRRIEKTTEG